MSNICSVSDPFAHPLYRELEQELARARNTLPKIVYAPELDVVCGSNTVSAIYYTGMPYRGLEKTRIFAYIGFPQGACREQPVPAVVCVHGGGGQAYPEWVRRWTERGYAAIAMDTYGKHPVGPDGTFCKDDLGGPEIDSMATGEQSLTEQWMYHAVTQAILAGNLLRADPRVQKDRVGITGISWGGHITANVIAHDDRFAFAVPVYGCAFLPGTAGAFAAHFEHTNAALLWDPSERLKDCKTPTLWFNGDADANFSINATQRSYEATPHGSILIHHGYIHSHLWGWAPEEIYAFADSVVRGRTPLAFPVQQPETPREFAFRMPQGASGVRAILYYHINELAYDGDYQLTEPWQSTEVSCQNGRTTVPHLDSAVLSYLSVSYTLDGRLLTTSTPLLSQSGTGQDAE